MNKVQITRDESTPIPNSPVRAAFSSEKSLRERTKEISCLLAISEACRSSQDLKHIFHTAVDALSAAFFYSDTVCARILLEDKCWQTANFRETEWRLSADLMVQGKTAGVVEVFYLEARPAWNEGSFLKEERNLLNLCADRLTQIIEALRQRELDRLDHQFRTLIAEISVRFVQVSDRRDFDEAMNETLVSLGQYFGADRSYLFRFSEDLSTMDNTHEWCAAGIAAQRHRIQQVPTGAFPLVVAKLLKAKPFLVSEVDAMPSSAEKDEFQAQGIQSLLCLPVFDSHRKVIAFMGYDAVQTPRVWPEKLIPLHQVLAEIIGSTIVRLEVMNELRESKERYRSVSEDTPILICRFLPDYTISYVNRAYCDCFGKSADELVGTSFLPFITDAALNAVKSTISSLTVDAPVVSFECQALMPDKTVCWQKWTDRALFDEAGRIVCYQSFGEDITERKRAEIYRKMGRDILQILNEPDDLRESIQRVLAVLKTRTGADAAGLRLQEGDDFPYFVQDGFSNDFRLAENTLFERGKDGGLCRDKDGNVSLECTCGRVLSGKTDPSNPLFTKGGSCWTNDSFPLLDLPSNQDPRLHPRSNCIHQGYASIALMPIRTKERIVGLLQLNYKSKDCFTLETIEILEGVAAHIGSALMRKRLEEELTRTHKARRALVKRLEQTQEEERTRIARDMHDDLGQNLTAIKMDLRWIERAAQNIADQPDVSAIGSRATAAIEMTDIMVATVQELAASLRPGVLDRLGVGPAIRFESRRFQARTGIVCRASLPDTLPPIPETTSTALFRIFQESLTNVARHSHATRASVRLGSKAGNIVLRIHDNGKGITQKAIEDPESLGLLGMMERAAAAGGHILLRRGKRRGTLVTIRMPLE